MIVRKDCISYKFVEEQFHLISFFFLAECQILPFRAIVAIYLKESDSYAYVL
jgi:hypothetical protein